MPKILINEIDNTSPGTPARYENYSVLIAGFAGKANPAGKVKPDTNGVYEFTSAEAFVAEIGQNGPAYVGDGGAQIFHYGNQMAYELLSMGYTVIYKPITSVDELFDPEKNMWDVFRDKATYDFRFVTHGLLESSNNQEANEVGERITYLYNARNIATGIAAEAKAEYELRKDEEGIVEDDLINERIQKTRTRDGEAPTWLNEPALANYTGNADYSSYANIITSIDNEIEWLNDQAASFGGLISEADIIRANKYIADLANYVATTKYSQTLPGRGDCLALIELDECTYANTDPGSPESKIINGISKMSEIAGDGAGRFCALTVPSVHYNRADDDNSPYNNNKKFPGGFHYLACFKESLSKGFHEWFAVAGYNRGTSSLAIDHTSVTLGEIAINALEPRYIVDDPNLTMPPFACNVIANFRGSYYLWGNRTACLLQSESGGGDLIASHFLNIRHLCATIKKQLYVACRRFTFDPNSDTLWFNFVNAIRPTLELMKANQGIRDYRIVKEYTDKKATLKAKVRIIPIEAVEDFDLTIYLEDSFGEATATVEE